jgi:hypothetical protein
MTLKVSIRPVGASLVVGAIEPTGYAVKFVPADFGKNSCGVAAENWHGRVMSLWENDHFGK